MLGAEVEALSLVTWTSDGRCFAYDLKPFEYLVTNGPGGEAGEIDSLPRIELKGALSKLESAFMADVYYADSRERIHAEICEDSPAECIDNSGLCVKAARALQGRKS